MIDLEPTNKEVVEANLLARDDALPTKNVLVTNPETGEKYYERRKEKETNMFITLNTHQIPKIGTNEKQYQLALELLINKLFSEEEMQRWISIKEPFLSKGDKLSFDFDSEECVLKSLRVVPAIEIGPINNMLHAHVIMELSHYTLLRTDAPEFGLRAAELWRALFPMDLVSDKNKDVAMKTILDCYREEKAHNAINRDYSLNEINLYGIQHEEFYHKTRRPALSRYWKGYHRITNTGQFLTFFKRQKIFVPKAVTRKRLEEQCRKYVDQHYDELILYEDAMIHNTKSMYAQLVLTQSNAEKARMNYISKNKAGAERGVNRLSTMRTEVSGPS